jgi:2-hydroxy-3-keto-5-methylthiopentenyl-1-phosphate phosphatase
MSERASLFKTHYFIDFDNTISQVDIWDTLMKTCDPARWRSVVGDYVEGKISSRQCNLELAQSVTLNEIEARNIVAEIGIDRTFHDFVAWAGRKKYPLMILSDGYQFYIDQLLTHEGLESIPVFCNRMVWTEGGIEVEFPLYKEDCERDMAHCKCQHVLAADNCRKVYIGDGVSDTCAAAKCDLVYAKCNLLDYCREYEIAHHPFANFMDVIEREETYLETIPANAEISVEPQV